MNTIFGGWLIHQVTRDATQDDKIIWKLAASGQYTTSSTYKAQSIGCTNSATPKRYLDHVGTAKVQVFHMAHPAEPGLHIGSASQEELGSQSDIPTVPTNIGDRPPSPGRVSLHETKYGISLRHGCYTRQVWNLFAAWVRQPQPVEWRLITWVKEWWIATSSKPEMPNRTARTITMLLTWEIWKERNARIFDNKELPAQALLGNIKIEANTWMRVGAKPLEFLDFGRIG